MARIFFIKYNDKFYATEKAVKKSLGKSSMIADVFKKAETILDQTFFELTEKEADGFLGAGVAFQDLDDRLRAVRKATGHEIMAATMANRLISISSGTPIDELSLGGLKFYRYCSLDIDKKYGGKLDEVATVKLCGFLYVALDCVKLGADRPFIITKK